MSRCLSIQTLLLRATQAHYGRTRAGTCCLLRQVGRAHNGYVVGWLVGPCDSHMSLESLLVGSLLFLFWKYGRAIFFFPKTLQNEWSFRTPIFCRCIENYQKNNAIGFFPILHAYNSPQLPRTRWRVGRLLQFLALVGHQILEGI